MHLLHRIGRVWPFHPEGGQVRPKAGQTENEEAGQTRVIVVMDLVADEVTRSPDRRVADVLRAWIEAGAQPGSDAPVRVEATETGRAVALARLAEPGFRLRNEGENAIIGWLVERVQDAGAGTVVLHENGRVPRVVAGQGRGADLDVLTTRAFLAMVES